MKLQFTPPRDGQQGLIASMLKRSYAEAVETDQEHWGDEALKWEEFDRHVFEHLDTVSACAFLSWAGDRIVGLASYDPRHGPEFGIVGHNCVLPEFRGQGFGRQQIDEVLRRLRARGIRLAQVSTLDNPFFAPARRMYTSCGFREIGRHEWDRDPRHSVIEYELNLDNERTTATPETSRDRLRRAA